MNGRSMLIPGNGRLITSGLIAKETNLIWVVDPAVAGPHSPSIFWM